MVQQKQYCMELITLSNNACIFLSFDSKLEVISSLQTLDVSQCGIQSISDLPIMRYYGTALCCVVLHSIDRVFIGVLFGNDNDPHYSDLFCR